MVYLDLNCTYITITSLLIVRNNDSAQCVRWLWLPAHPTLPKPFLLAINNRSACIEAKFDEWTILLGSSNPDSAVLNHWLKADSWIRKSTCLDIGQQTKFSRVIAEQQVIRRLLDWKGEKKPTFIFFSFIAKTVVDCRCGLLVEQCNSNIKANKSMKEEYRKCDSWSRSNTAILFLLGLIWGSIKPNPIAEASYVNH